MPGVIDHFFKPVHDPDGDIVRCRWAESVRSECGSVCNALTKCTLNPDTVGVQCLCMFVYVSAPVWLCVCVYMCVCVCVCVHVCARARVRVCV